MSGAYIHKYEQRLLAASHVERILHPLSIFYIRICPEFLYASGVMITCACVNSVAGTESPSEKVANDLCQIQL